MRLYALIVLALAKTADIVLGVDVWRGVGGPSKSQSAFMRGKW